jgi:citrate lyase subunit beta/citryl-CoA lyase
MQPIPRSYLFVPGNRPDRFQKALNSGAHAVILDLEDGVAPSNKQAARESVAQWLHPDRPSVLRVNGIGTEWFEEDLALCGRPGVAAVILPKAECSEQVQELVRPAGAKFALLPLIESARGFDNARAIASCQGVQRLIFGPLDFQADLGIDGDNEELLFFRSQLVLLSRLAGIEPPVDGPTTAIGEPELVRAEALRARRLGFGGKLCIHPRQVPIVNECFAPTPAEVEWAEKIMEAAARSGGGAVAVDGKMVDRPVILLAERIWKQGPRR